MGGERHAPALLIPGNSKYPFYRRLGGTRGQSGWVQKIPSPTVVRTPVYPAHSKSLHALLYPGSLQSAVYYHVHFPTHIYFLLLLSIAQQPLVGHGLLIIEASRSHSDTPHSVGLLWTCNQSDEETST
jgi:hypothetical protein